MLRRHSPIIATIFVIISIFFALTPSVVRAESSTLSQNLKDYCAKRSGNQMNLETWYSGKCTDDTFSGDGVGFADMVILDLAEKVAGKNDPDSKFSDTFKAIITGLSYKITPTTSPEEKAQYLAEARQEYYNQQSGGLVGEAADALAFSFQPLASTREYLAYVSGNLQNHHIVPQTLAVSDAPYGTGFKTFSGLIKLWAAIRNVAYLALVVFFIVYGFMMMFRVNLGQKTVISIQLAIPKLIVTLLIITFSYAIVGLIIDIMWVLIYFVFQFLVTQGLITDVAGTNMAFGNKGMFNSFIANFLASIPASSIAITRLITGSGAAEGLSNFISVSGFGFIISLIVLIAVVISYLKLFWKLFQSLIAIVISLISGPIVLLGNAFPGSAAIGNWFRNILANAIVFPATMLFLLLSYILMAQPILDKCQEDTDIIPGVNVYELCEGLIGVTGFTNNAESIAFPMVKPISGGFQSADFVGLIGVGLLLMAGKYVDIVKNALKVSPFKYGSAIMEPLKTAQGQISGLRKGMRESGGGSGGAAVTTPAATTVAPEAPSAPRAVDNSFQTSAATTPPEAPAAIQEPQNWSYSREGD